MTGAEVKKIVREERTHVARDGKVRDPESKVRPPKPSREAIKEPIDDEAPSCLQGLPPDDEARVEASMERYRQTSSVIEQALLMAEAKESYERLHPETVHANEAEAAAFEEYRAQPFHESMDNGPFHAAFPRIWKRRIFPP